MEWWWLLGVVPLCALAAWRIFRTYNTLSLHHSLCLAAWQQLNSTLAMRHTLVGALLSTCQPGEDVDNARAALGAAERLAKQGGSARERHVVEMDLLAATRDMVPRGEDERSIAEQLATINGWVASSARYYNQNVDRYLRRRSGPSAWLIRASFPAMTRFAWPSEEKAFVEEADDTEVGVLPVDAPIREADNPEGYLPASLSNIARRRLAGRTEPIRRDDSLEA